MRKLVAYANVVSIGFFFTALALGSGTIMVYSFFFALGTAMALR